MEQWGKRGEMFLKSLFIKNKSGMKLASVCCALATVCVVANVPFNTVIAASDIQGVKESLDVGEVDDGGKNEGVVSYEVDVTDGVSGGDNSSEGADDAVTNGIADNTASDEKFNTTAADANISDVGSVVTDTADVVSSDNDGDSADVVSSGNDGDSADVVNSGNDDDSADVVSSGNDGDSADVVNSGNDGDSTDVVSSGNDGDSADVVSSDNDGDNADVDSSVDVINDVIGANTDKKNGDDEENCVKVSVGNRSRGETDLQMSWSAVEGVAYYNYIVKKANSDIVCSGKIKTDNCIELSSSKFVQGESYIVEIIACDDKNKEIANCVSGPVVFDAGKFVCDFTNITDDSITLEYYYLVGAKSYGISVSTHGKNSLDGKYDKCVEIADLYEMIGEKVRYTYEGLSEDTEYYVTITLFDEVGNELASYTNKCRTLPEE